MSIVVRQACLDADRHTIVELLRRHLTPLSNDSRFEWLYLNNPHGRANAWITMQTDQNKPIGMAAAFPRRVLIHGHQVLGWILGDFCISDEHRSLGPALQLQRACLEAVDSGMIAFCYDFPSSSMMAVYRRLRVPETGTMVRLAKPLRVDRKVGESVKIPWINRSVSVVGNLLLQLIDGLSSLPHDLKFSLQQLPCGNEFTSLATQVADQYGIHIERSAAYLNWRFLSNPLSRHEMLTARSQGRLVGYVVFTQTGEDGTLIDLFGQTHPKIMGGLIKALLRLLRERRVVTVSAPLYSAHPLMSTLLELGFKKRESTPVVIYRGSHLRNPANGTNGTIWSLTSGDRDT